VAFCPHLAKLGAWVLPAPGQGSLAPAESLQHVSERPEGHGIMALSGTWTLNVCWSSVLHLVIVEVPFFP